MCDYCTFASFNAKMRGEVETRRAASGCLKISKKPKD